ncbi:TatD family hydrolase [Gallibacterium salpingitidis]|uniref:Deoxyribonuclease n=1 Tax=Gallibacterium salpingitidis TaxID=505341 RepID=A0A1A7P0H3_9PAST|nr:TatD family hydrolase [Gallibacterium salpingitidis]OBW95947.1 deoxyribonuclease [Gallibacterium salpingitidis]
MFFDTHTHLDYLAMDLQQSLAQIVASAQSQQVTKLLVVAIDRQNILTMPQWVSNQTNVYYGLGLHPLFIARHHEDDLLLLEQSLAKRDGKCIAVAEIGLDRYPKEITTDELWQKQCYFLEAQLALSKQYQLPVNLHSRRSHDQLYTFLKKADLAQRGVVHGFAGSYEQAKRFVDLGYKIGVGGTITYERANKTRQAIAKLPLSALLLETDSPDMPVFGWQGQPNHPAHLPLIFQSLVALRTESAAQIEAQIWQNSLELFALSETV